MSYLDDIETPSQRLLRATAPRQAVEGLALIGCTALGVNVYGTLEVNEEAAARRALGMFISGSGPEAVGFAPTPTAYGMLVEADSAKTAFLRAIARVCAQRFTVVHGGQRFLATLAGTPNEERMGVDPPTVLVCTGPTPSSPPVVLNWSWDSGFDLHTWTIAALGQITAGERDFVNEPGTAFFAAADAAEREHRAAFDKQTDYDRQAWEFARDDD